MSSSSQTKNQEENNSTKAVETEAITQEELPLTTKIKTFFSSWKFKLTIILITILFLSYIVFFWQHIMAVKGMKTWASHAKATPIDCMMKDTNNDGYISCTAKLDDQVVPLECGTDILNIGCRVNYGTASPSMRKSVSVGN